MPGTIDPVRKLIFVAWIAVTAVLLMLGDSMAQSVDDQYGLAAGFYSRGQWAESEEAFRAVIATFPNTDQASASHFFLGEALVQLQSYAEGYPEYQTFVTRLPNHRFAPRARFRMAECAYRTGRVSQAANLLENFIRTYPNHDLKEFALPYLGEARLHLKEPQLAQNVFESALQLYPQSTMSDQCRFGLAKSLQALGAYPEALRFYQFIATQPGNPLAGNAYKQIGIMDFAQGYYEKARSSLGQAVPRLTDQYEQTETTYWLARSEMSLGNFELAFEHFNSVAEYQADDALGAAILFDGAVAATKANNIAQATRWLSRLRKKWPESQWADDALQMQIDVAYRDGNNEEAMAWIAQFANEYPDSESLPKILEFAGRIHYQRKDYQKTIDTFEELLAKFPDNDNTDIRNSIPVWRYFIGLGHVGLNEYQTALDQLEMVDTSNQDTSFVASVAIASASALIGLGRNNAAIPLLQDYLAASPDGKQAARARAELAIAFVKSEQWDQADVAMKDLHQKHDGPHLVLKTAQFLAETAFKAKKHRHAESWFEIMADAGNPKQYVTRGLSGLAWARMESSQSEKALSTFERLLNEYPDSEYAAEAGMARGKFLEDNAEHREATQMYCLVYTRFGESKLADVARLQCAYNLQKVGDNESLVEAKNLLTDYLQTNNDVQTKDEALYQLAWVYLDLNHPEHGQKRFEQLSQEYPGSRFWVDATYRVAEKAVREKDYDKAEATIQNLLNAEAPNEVLTRVLYLKGQISAKKKDWQVVGETMTALLEKTDDKSMYAKANYWLAESLFQRGQYVSSGDVFEQLVEKKDLVSEQLAPWIYLRNAQCLAYNEKWMLALDAAERGKEKFTAFSSGYEFDFVRGRALASLGRLKDAREAYEKVIASANGGSTETAAIAQWRIGETYFHQEDYKRAIGAYYKVDSLFSHKKWRAAALFQAGKCQEHLGNWQHATKLYKQLIDQFPDSEYRDDAEKRMELATRQAKRQPNTTR